MGHHNEALTNASNSELSYIAGILDGEGSISIARAAGTDRFSLIISIYNTDEPIIRWVAAKAGGGNVFHYRYPATKRWRDRFTWNCPQSYSESFLRKLLPFLLIKRQEAQVAITFRESYLPIPRAGIPRAGRHVTQSLIDFREGCRQSIAALKKQASKEFIGDHLAPLDGNCRAAYFAAIIDGEGCLMITETRPKAGGKSPTFEGRVTISNTNPGLIHWLTSHFGGIVHKDSRALIVRPNNSQVSWRWSALHRDAAAILESALPYIQVKKKRANMLLDFFSRIKQAKARGLKRGLTEEDIKGRRLLRDKISWLNQHGEN